MLSQSRKFLVTVTVLICALTSISSAVETVSIVLCQEISEADGTPIGAAETFNNDVSQIQAKVIAGDCPAGTKVKGVWVSVDAIDVPNYEIDAVELVFQEAGGGQAFFSLSRPDNGWPMGNYKLDIYIGDQLAQSAPFSIIAGTVEQVTETTADVDTVTAEKLQALEQARQAGILSEEEYNRKKTELMQESAGTVANTTNAPQGNVITPPPLPPTGQFYQTSHGVRFWYPAGWTIKDDNNKLQLIPENPLSIADAPTEYYVINVQKIGGNQLQNLNSPVIQQYIQTQIKSISAILKPKGSPDSIAAQSGPGLVYNWESDILQGLGITLTAKTYVGYSNNCLTTLIGFGPKELVQAREQQLNHVFTSIASGQGQDAISVGSDPLFTNPQSNTGGNTANPAPNMQTGFNGTYTLTNQGTTLTLTMNQNAQGVITGNLSSTTGVQYQLNGQVEEDVAAGICTSSEGVVFFEGELQGNQLMLSLINVGAGNMPDYNKARQLIFIKSQAASARPAQPMPQPTPPQQGTNQSARATSATLGDPSWGFSFAAPQGWTGQKTAQNITLTNSSIAGTIVVFPHTDSSLQQVHTNMQQGLVEESVNLSPVTQITRLNNNTLAADYSGMVNGQQMKARGVGTFNPNGGGAYIVALVSPQQYSQQLANAAESIAANMQYSQPRTSSNLVQHFAGQWWTYNATTAVYETAHLGADGSFSSSSEYSAHVEATDGYGTVTSTGDVYSSDENSGRWIVRGNIDSGVLIITYPDGSQDHLNYQVHIENGQRTNTYSFDGQVWHKGDPP